MTKSKKYAIKVSTGNGPYRWLTGWDGTFATRAEAKACAERASRNDGWSAKVVVVVDSAAGGV